jgi:16S rRNA (uracil1498-N3)-methyltransferase
MRRIHLPSLRLGPNELPPNQAHYLRDVLRLGVGDEIEAFDATGNRGRGRISDCASDRMVIEIQHIEPPPIGERKLAVASAIPKSARADWMIEKLSELGIARFIPLSTQRSVVLPEGEKKFERWRRLASEAARQSGRGDVMHIDSLISLDQVISQTATDFSNRWHLDIGDSAQPIIDMTTASSTGSILIFIGPEGGWTGEESSAFASAGVLPVQLTATTLRVETAAVAAAAIIASALTAAGPLGSIQHP